MAKSYIREHLTQSILYDDEMDFIVEMCSTQTDLVRVRFQSRHINQKRHIATVRFDSQYENPILGYYCTCTSGAREVGCCVHVAAILWHLGVQGGNTDNTLHPLSAVKILQAVNDTMQNSTIDEDENDDEDERYILNQQESNSEDESSDGDASNATDTDD